MGFWRSLFRYCSWRSFILYIVRFGMFVYPHSEKQIGDYDVNKFCYCETSMNFDISTATQLTSWLFWGALLWPLGFQRLTAVWRSKIKNLGRILLRYWARLTLNWVKGRRSAILRSWGYRSSSRGELKWIDYSLKSYLKNFLARIVFWFSS